MKIKNIIKYNYSLENILKKKLPIKASFIIAKNKKKIDDILEIYDKKRIDLVEKYAIKNDEGEIIIDNNGNAKINNLKSFSEELEELWSIEQNFEIEYITFQDLEKCDTGNFDSLSPSDISQIQWMIEEEN